MSVKDLIANWEEALALALSPDEDPVTEMHDDDLTNVADRQGITRSRIRSNVHAGLPSSFTCGGFPLC